MKELSFTIPGWNGGNVQIQPPNNSNVPTGGLSALETIIQNGITILLITATLLSFFFLLWGGIQWIISGGDKQGVEKARGRITWAIVGLVISFLSFLIINMLAYFFNVPLIGR